MQLFVHNGTTMVNSPNKLLKLLWVTQKYFSKPLLPPPTLSRSFSVPSDSIKCFTALHKKKEKKKNSNFSVVNDVHYVNKTRLVSPLSSRHNPPATIQPSAAIITSFCPWPPFISTFAALINQKCVFFPFSTLFLKWILCNVASTSLTLCCRHVTLQTGGGSVLELRFAPTSDSLYKERVVEKSLRTHWELRKSTDGEINK